MSELKHMHAKIECLHFDTEDVRLVITERYGRQEIRMHGEDAKFIVEAIAAAKRRAQPEANADAKDADESLMKAQLDQIGKSIGYGRAIQILGQLWDDMLQAQYSIASRHQESMFRREDIERTEAGLPIGRKVVYYQKRGNKGEITAWMPFDAEIPNVLRIVSDTPLYGRPSTPTTDAPQAKGSEVDCG